MIDSLEEQEAQGSFTPSGRMDILAASIGKPDYPGRVRGVGKGVGLKQYFGPISRNSPEMISREEFHGLLAKVKEETQAEVCQKLESLMAELRDEFKSMVANMVAGQGAERTPQVSHTVQSTKDSCSPPKTLTLHAPSPTLDDGAPCYLYLEQTKKQVVAQARAYMLGSTSNNMLGSTIHHEEIQEDQVRVMVVVVLEANAKVPFPIDEIVEVGQAKDAFILWPKRLIDMEMTLPMDPKTVEKFPCLAQLHEFFKAMTNAIDLKMPTGIMGSEKSYPFKIDKKDLMEFIFMKELDMSWANLTILYLHNLCIAMGKDNLYGFLCPNSLQLAHNTLDQRIIYVSNTIRESKLPCYLAPIIQGSHWSLCVACPFDNVVYWFCSLGSTPSEEMKGVLNTALKIYYMMGGKCNENKDSTTWIYPKCPQQARSTECGYYVIHYMHEIVQFDSTAKLQEFFDNNDPCTSENIDVIRNALAQQILQELSAQKLGVQLS
ncbi:uncharacterized protein LOC129322047 isoform X2 [Prosopis cineraria]|uniref:uncharacterized protein LOC129322047 isoform X2 n=1 Tax=Prosopis cineraria TaxID=364024 RepID=UPI00240FE8F5|nr:uncharacterized protein LOC129322047 isoform X2 [Prosopis cineraria]